MTKNYDCYAIIIGAGQNDLTPDPSTLGEGNAPFENKSLRFHRGLRNGFTKLSRLGFLSRLPKLLLPIGCVV